MTRPIDALLTRSRIAFVAVGAGIASLLVAGCGSPAGAGPGSLSIPSLPSGVRATPTGTTGPTSGDLGDTLVMKDSGDDIAHVTLIKVFDPATGVGDIAPPDGTRWVGFEGTIVINGARSGQDPTGVAVIGSDGQTYGADTAYGLSKFDGCSATDAGDGLPPGVTQTFCSGVGLPPGVTVVKVGYSTEDVSGNAPAVLFWNVAAAAAPSTPTATPALSSAASAASGMDIGVAAPVLWTVP